MVNTDNFTTFLPIFPFQILSEVREKSEARVLKAFSAAEIFLSQPVLGSPNRPIRHIFQISSLFLLAEILAKLMSFRLGKLNNRGGGGKAVPAIEIIKE